MMQCFIFLSTMLAVAFADGYYYGAPPAGLPTLSIPAPAHAPLILRAVGANPAAASTLLQALQQQQQQQQQQYQFHTQDAYGQYAYGYAEPRSSKQEVRTLDGVTRGSYSYVDAEGKLQTVAYTADTGGFRVAATNLPQQQQRQQQSLQPVRETPEVAAARAQHLAAHQQAKLRYFEAAAAAAAVAAPTHRPTAATERKIVEQIVELPRPVEDTPEVAAAKVEFFKRYAEVKERNERLQQQQQREKNQEQGLGYTLVKSQPIAVSLPLPSYRAANSGLNYGYDLVVPSVNGAYLTVA